MMFDFAFLFFMLMRQFFVPIVTIAAMLWSWAFFGDTALVPQTELGRKAQEVIYNVKFHPITRNIITFLSSADFSDEMRDIASTIKENTGLERINAVKALGMLGEDAGAQALPLLVWTLYDPNPEVRNTAVASIRNILEEGKVPPDHRGEMKDMLQTLRLHPNETVRDIVLSVLKATGYTTVPGQMPTDRQTN